MYLPFDLSIRRRVARAIVSGSLLLLTTAAIFEMTGCGTASESNNSAANANRASGNMNIATNTMTNTMSNSSQPETDCLPNDIVDADALKSAMKTRLKHDNEHFMPDGNWDTDKWLDINVGAFYRNDDETARLMVCDITDRTLRTVNKQLKPFARQKLYDGVSGSTKCRAAVDLMLKATRSTTSIEAVP